MRGPVQFDDEPLPRVGQLIELTITGYDSAEGLLVLSRKGAVMATTWQALREGAIVEGRVTGHNKGGLELVIDGIKAFMPISQVERGRVEEVLPKVSDPERLGSLSRLFDRVPISAFSYTFVAPTELLRSIGGWDEELVWGEYTDFLIRLARVVRFRRRDVGRAPTTSMSCSSKVTRSST